MAEELKKKKIEEFESEYFKKFKEFKITAHKKSGYGLDWNCNGKYLASADNIIKIWKYKNMVLQKDREIKAHTENVECLQWHPTQKQTLCSCSKDSVKLWKIRETRAVLNYKTKSDNAFLTWSPDGSVLAVGNKDNIILLFDSSTFKPIQELRLKDQELSEFMWDPKGSIFFVTACQKNIGYIQVYDGKNPTEPLEQFECHRAMVNTICSDQQGKYFATGGNDAVVGVWNTYEMICTHAFTQMEGIVKKLSFSHDSTYLAAISDDNYIDIYNNDKKFLSHRIKCSSGQLVAKWHPYDMVLAYTGEQKDKDQKEMIINLIGLESKSSND